MNIKQSLLLVSMVLISLIAISAVSAADNATSVAEVSDIDEVQAIDNVDESVAAENGVVLKVNGTATGDDSDKKTTTFGAGKGNTKFDFSNITFDLGNGTKFNLSDLLNGTTISFGNGTSFNITDLLNSNMTFGNGTSFNITNIMNMTGNGTGSFNISAILDMLDIGGSKIVFNATDINQVYSGPTTFVVTITEKDKPVSQKDIIFSINNKDYVARTDQNGTVNFKIDLAAGTYYIYTEYNDQIAKNQIVINKATSKIVASAKTFKKSVKTKKYTITLKNNKNKVIKNAKVTLKVNGKTYTAKTNSNGKATFKITKLTKTGKHTATIKFAGNGYYKASSASKKITVK